MLGFEIADGNWILIQVSCVAIGGCPQDAGGDQQAAQIQERPRTDVAAMPHTGRVGRDWEGQLTEEKRLDCIEWSVCLCRCLNSDWLIVSIESLLSFYQSIYLSEREFEVSFQQGNCLIGVLTHIGHKHARSHEQIEIHFVVQDRGNRILSARNEQKSHIKWIEWNQWRETHPERYFARFTGSLWSFYDNEIEGEIGTNFVTMRHAFLKIPLVMAWSCNRGNAIFR